MKGRQAIIVGTALSVVIILSAGFSHASAASANISRSYKSTSSIQTGSLVSVVPGKTGYVESSNSSNAESLIGVTVISSQSLLAVNASKSTVQVATDGTVNGLVSTINGSISVGQQIAVSPFNGVGMKSEAGDRVIGIAQTAFNSKSPGATSETVKDSSGQSHNILVGFVRLTIDVGSTKSPNFSLASIQELVQNLTGHPISIVRLI